MTKIEIKNELVLLQEHLIDDLNKMLDTYKTGLDLDEEDVFDSEDLSHQGEATAAANELKGRVGHAKEDLIFIENFALENFEEIKEHAVVKTKELNFIVGAAILPFTFRKEKYVGISLKAPIYQMMKGKKKGDVFNFGKHKYEIEEIL